MEGWERRNKGGMHAMTSASTSSRDQVWDARNDVSLRHRRVDGAAAAPARQASAGAEAGSMGGRARAAPHGRYSSAGVRG